MNGTPIRRAEPSEAGALALLIADAFHDLPLCRWLVPDPVRRRGVLPANFRIFVEHAIEHGTVHTTGELDAVAVWYSDAPHGVPDVPDYDQRLAEACGPHTQRFRLLDEAMHDAHPGGPAHDYLAFLAVSPDVQCRGLGSQLLGLCHRDLDERRVPSYVEASTPRSRRLYLRNGYVDIDEPFTARGGPDPTMWPLWRDPS